MILGLSICWNPFETFWFRPISDIMTSSPTTSLRHVNYLCHGESWNEDRQQGTHYLVVLKDVSYRTRL